MNYYSTVQSVSKLWLASTLSILGLVTILGCGVFSTDVPSTPTPRAVPTAQTTDATKQPPSSEASDKTVVEETDLYRAIWTNDPDAVKELVAQGEDVNAKDSEGDPYLHEAIWRGHLEVAQVLIDAGADVNAKDTDGNPLLHEAVWRDHVEVAQVLIDAGADVNARDSDGNPLLYEAIWRDHVEVAQVLIDAGADVNAKDSDDNPLLREAVWRDHRGIVQVLISAGADIDARDADNEPVLYAAVWRGRARLREFSSRPERTSTQGGPTESRSCTWRVGGTIPRSRRFYWKRAPRNRHGRHWVNQQVRHQEVRHGYRQ